jgi:hypothetical protein
MLPDIVGENFTFDNYMIEIFETVKNCILSRLPLKKMDKIKPVIITLDNYYEEYH